MINRTIIVILFGVLFCFASAHAAGKKTVIGVVTDGPSIFVERAVGLINTEIQLITQGEFDVQIPVRKRLNGGWTLQGIEAALDDLYKDKDVDMVIALGFSSAVVAAKLHRHPKPTFAAVILDDRLSGAPRDGNRSGKHNLNYLSLQGDLKTEIEAFRRVVEFQKVALLSDALIPEVMPNIAKGGIATAKELGINMLYVPHNGNTDVEDLVAQIPEDVDAVLIGALGRMSEDEQAEMLAKLLARGLPSYSLLGSKLVEQGALVTAIPAQNWQQRARRIALNVQATLFGDNPQDMKVVIDGKRRLIINMATARKLGVSPPFDVMLEAKKLHGEEKAVAKHWTLSEVAQTVLTENLGVRASSLGVGAGETQVREAKSILLPQLSVNGNYLLRNDENGSVQSGGLAEQQGSISLNISQILYDENSLAKLDIEKLRQTAKMAQNKQLELDAIESATVAFLNVLQAKTLKDIRNESLELTRTNLELAQDRVKIGIATRADIYRWESELARSTVDLINAHSSLKQAQESLNQLLNRPLDERFSLEPATLDDPSLVMNDPELAGLITNEARFKSLANALIGLGLDRSPEIARLVASLAEQRRTLKSERSSYWSPTLSLSGELSYNYYDSRTGANSLEGEDDWSLGLNLSLPLYKGGARSHRVGRARLTRDQIRLQLEDTHRTVEQTIRARLHATQASRLSIGLYKDAAASSRKNLDLVSDSYRKGVATVVDLIDAQNSAVTADLNASSTSFQFLIDLMNLQRSTGAFDFFLDDGSRRAAVQSIKDAVASGE